MHDFGFSSSGTDIVDVGSDLLNSEINNTILCAADFTDTGLITEESLRRVHDAYAHCAARMCIKRWADPSANLNGMLYCWHICNERHWFMRRVLLGRAKARVHVGKREQREADFDEVFDEDFRTTGFTRPLRNPCDGGSVRPCPGADRFERRAGAGTVGRHLVVAVDGHCGVRPGWRLVKGAREQCG